MFAAGCVSRSPEVDGDDVADVEADGSHGGGCHGDGMLVDGGGGGVGGGVPGCRLCFHRFHLTLCSCSTTS